MTVNVKGNDNKKAGPNSKMEMEWDMRENRIEQNGLHCHRTTSSYNKSVILSYIVLW